MALERELETYRRKLPELLAAHAGKYVVIHLDEIVGFADSLQAALVLGYDKFLSDAFLARQVTKGETVVYIPRSLKPCHT